MGASPHIALEFSYIAVKWPAHKCKHFSPKAHPQLQHPQTAIITAIAWHCRARWRHHQAIP